MPSQLIDNHPMPIAPSPYFSPHFPFPSQRHVGFNKADIFRNQYGIKPDATPGTPCTTPYASVTQLQLDSLPAAKEQLSFTLQRHAIGADKPASHSLSLWDSMDTCSGTKYNSNLESSWDKSNRLPSHYENGLFSSSTKLFNTKSTQYEEEEPFESSEEIEAKTIGNLLPSDDDLLSGVVDGVQRIGHPREEEDIEDLELFSSVGGMDFGDDAPFGGERNLKLYGNFDGQWGGTNVSTTGKHPYGEHPSRTLFVRNVDSNVEDSELRALFEQYGDVQTLYTACKLRGLVMISYYDIRAAQNAKQSLQNNPLRHKRLDIHYSIPKDKDVNPGTLVVFNLDSSISNDDVHKIFGAYGEIKEIRETPQNSKRIVEFYDVRAADEALCALNWSEIAGKKIRIGPICLGVAKRSSMLPLYQELDLDEGGFCLPLSNAGFNSFGHANGHLVGHHSTWSNLNHSQPPAFMWPNSPPFTNRFCASKPQHRLRGLARSPSHMLNSISPNTRNGAVNHSIWEECSSFAGGSPDASGLNQGPVGSMKISDSHMHHVDLPSCNMSPHVGGNCMDIPVCFRDVDLHSFQHRSTVYPNRSQMNMGGSLETHSGRCRSHRNDSSSSLADNKKQYELDIDIIRRGEDNRTTLMIKNIPNKYTSKMLMAAIDEHHHGTYDFIYLPIDFKNKCNVGYAFINMVDPSHIVAFYETFNGKKWEKFNSEKVALLAYARIQGKSALITHFQNSSLMNEDKRCRPILFRSEGPNTGDKVPFPMGVNVRSRAGRSRSGSNNSGGK